MKEEVILTILPHQLREVLKRENIDFQSIQEIRLRVGKPLILLYRGFLRQTAGRITSQKMKYGKC